ncbi:MAG: hypothetical protein ACFCUX_00040 [Candidatus Methylacidiphilales bacterium]
MQETPGPLFWIYLIVLISVVGILVPLGIRLWEYYGLTPEERWRRKYDRRMKKFFKNFG